MKVARIYLRVSADDQDLTRQASIAETTRAAGYYIAGTYAEKASGARADRPELLRLIADLQPGEAVVAERIDRISRLPLKEAEQLVGAIRAKGARLVVPGIVDQGSSSGHTIVIAATIGSNCVGPILRLDYLCRSARSSVAVFESPNCSAAAIAPTSAPRRPGASASDARNSRSARSGFF